MQSGGTSEAILATDEIGGKRKEQEKRTRKTN